MTHEPPQSHMSRMLGLINSLMETAKGAQGLQQGQQQMAMMPAQLEQEQAKTGLINQQSQAEQLANQAQPEMMAARRMENLTQGVGAFGRGAAMADPQHAPQLLQQLLQLHYPGAFQPDPDADMKARAAKLGLDVQTYKDRFAPAMTNFMSKMNPGQQPQPH